MKSTEKQKMLPAKETSYKNTIPSCRNTSKLNCTYDMNVACNAIRLNPWAYVGYDDDNGACFKFFPESKQETSYEQLKVFSDAPEVIREGQRQTVEKYWQSKRWSEQVEAILARPNGLSDFGQGLYHKLLEAERQRRYRYKRRLRTYNRLLGIKPPEYSNCVDKEVVKDRIVEVAHQYTELRQRGKNLWGLCPMHQEKTPSFVVNPDRRSWYCFGACSRGGDVFDLLQIMDGKDFISALKELA